ncbi:hypothetical protein D3C83_110870 [compost metagenome]
MGGNERGILIVVVIGVECGDSPARPSVGERRPRTDLEVVDGFVTELPGRKRRVAETDIETA